MLAIMWKYFAYFATLIVVYFGSHITFQYFGEFHTDGFMTFAQFVPLFPILIACGIISMWTKSIWIYGSSICLIIIAVNIYVVSSAIHTKQAREKGLQNAMEHMLNRSY